MRENAILLTGGFLDQPGAKTAHGLLRSSLRYHIKGVIDRKFPGKDAGVMLDGVERYVKVYGSVEAFLDEAPARVRYAIVGVAFPGGKIPADMLNEIKVLISAGISIVSGLHDYLADMPEISALAAANGVELIDIRKPRPKSELKFWTGAILGVKSPVIGVLGTDCALGKRTTACRITEVLQLRGINAQMVYTGQTGWLQGYKYGFILDSTYNDFISGELENAVVTCYNETRPEVIFVEGQSALCNPSGPCGSELLLSAQCKGVILQHAPARKYFNGQEHTGITISLKKEIDIIGMYGGEIIAITLNTGALDVEQAKAYQQAYERAFNIPVILPLEEGMGRLEEVVVDYMHKFVPAPELPKSYR